jgi:hypothetical protein
MTYLRITLFAGLLVILLAACPSTKNQAFAGFITGNDLYSNCKDPNAYKSNTCLGYIAAVTDIIQFFDSNICITEDVNLGQLKDIVVAWLTRKPQHRHDNASGLVFAALAEAFPCKS